MSEGTLRAAVRDARRLRIGPATALIAGGAISDTHYHFSLADHLGLAFVWDWPTLAPTADATIALRCRRVRLANGRWLIAPDDTTGRLLLEAHQAGIDFSDFTITTPARFQAIVRQRLPEQIAQTAAEALSTVAPDLSACGALSKWKAMAIGVVAVASLVAIFSGVRFATDSVGIVFFAALLFRLLVSATGLPSTADEPAPVVIGDAEAPTYSVLVPLHEEAPLVPSLVDALSALDYPLAKLEILFLVEAHDAETRIALLAAGLPSHMRVVVVPEGQPRTKPRALNAGLMFASGALVTVYDAEDRPDPDQLRRAAARFARGPDDLACVQARLAISNGRRGLIPSLFAIEYAALFDLFNVGLARRGLPIPLGGTSNHLRASSLRRAGGWDASNVTEDADLGLRLARLGYGVAELPSVTREPAEAEIGRWFSQRRRWTKGWMQTALVLLRGIAPLHELGPRRAIAVALTLVNLVGGPLLSPFVLILISWRLAQSGVPHPHTWLEVAEATLHTSVLALGVATPLGCGFAGMRARGIRFWARLPLTIPYQLMISAAAWLGLIDLMRRPYHWRKTTHTVFEDSIVHRAQRCGDREGRGRDGAKAQGA